MSSSTATPPSVPCADSSLRRELLVFVLCSVGCLLFVFRAALLNSALLAPLDVAPAFYAHYQWLDPASGAVPRNHYVIDIFDHELPRQWSIHRAVQAGEFPWWDPYTDGGRPLAAEAHISGTDVLRLLLYHALPFVPAYNLTKLLHSFLLGLGAFLLLRQFGHRGWLALTVALSFQFAGSHTLFQTPLCVPAAAVYYPWLWLAWTRFLQSRRPVWLAAAGALSALSIAAGNPQTHAFLAVLALGFLLGQLWHDGRTWKPALLAAVAGPALGALLALPVLLPQLELYLLCERGTPLASGSRLLVGAASVTGFFPWLLGTFRTIDASKFFGETGIGFSVFIGCAAAVLAAVGAAGLLDRPRRSPARCVAAALVFSCLVIGSTPLISLFYTRLGVLAVLGLAVLAAEGARDLLTETATPWQRRAFFWSGGGVLAAFMACNLFAFALYPQLARRVEARLLEGGGQIASLDAVPELRRFQARNLPREISVLNPETLAGALSVAGLLCAGCACASRRRWFAVALVINVLPSLLFAERFTIKSPVAQWRALVGGGPEQRRVVELVAGGQRLVEVAPGRFGRLFPGALAHLYAVHVSHGYSSFGLPDMAARLQQELPGARLADAIYASTGGSQPLGGLESFPPGPTPARFQWTRPSSRRVRILWESLNSISLAVEDGPAGVLCRTDRYYPGWELVAPRLETSLVGHTFLAANVPAGPQQLTFRYRPRFFLLSAGVSVVTLLACAVCCLVSWRRRSTPG